MNYRHLGASGLQISELSLGSWTTYGGSVAAEDAARIVHRAFELGVNLFDTADVYVRGEAERALARAIKDLPREQIVVATKVMGRVWDGPLGAGLSRKHIFDAVHQSLTRLGLDYIDLYQAHAPDAKAPIEETLRAFEDLVRSGKVRHIGFSNFDREPELAHRAVAIQKERRWEQFISSQPRYSLVDRAVEKEHVAFCAANGIGMIVYSPLAQGVLSNKYAGGATPEGSRATTKFAHFLTQEKALTPENVAAAERFAAWVRAHTSHTPAQVALAWVLGRPGVSSVIMGASRVEQLEENVGALEVKLDTGQWAEVEAAIAGSAAAKSAARKPAAKPTPAKSPAAVPARAMAKATLRGRRSR